MLTRCPHCDLPLLVDDEPVHVQVRDSSRRGKEFALIQSGDCVHRCEDEARRAPEALPRSDHVALCSLLERLERASTLRATAKLIADGVAPLLGAAYASLAIVEGEQLRIVHHESLEPALARKYVSLPIDRTSPLGTAALTCRPVVLPSLAVYAQSFPHKMADMQTAGLSASLSFPLRDSAPSDVIGVGWSDWEGRDADDVIKVLANIGQSCTYAIDKVGASRAGTTRRDRRASRVARRLPPARTRPRP
jgi:hypothetical protein